MKFRLLLIALLGAVSANSSSAQTKPATTAAAPVVVGDVNAPDQLISAILEAHTAGAKLVKITPGIYKIPTGAGHYAWALHDVSDLTIDAGGATLAFSDTAFQMMDFQGCKNIVLRGGVITGPPNFTQGQIVSAGQDENGPYIDVALDEGYPTDWDNNVHWDKTAPFQVFDAVTRRFKPATGDYEVEVPPVAVDEATRQYRFHVRDSQDLLPDNGRVVKGDLVGIRGHAGCFWNVDHCSNIKFQDVTVETANANMWEAGGNQNVVIDHCNFTYQSAPVAKGTPGLLGPTGILSGNNRNGLVITNTLWQGADDDIINSDAGHITIRKAEGKALTFSGGFVSKGDTLSFYDPNAAYLGRAVVTDEPQDAPAPPDAGPDTKWRLATLDNALTLPAKSQAFNINHTSLDFTMRNCVFQNFRDVGLIISGENAVIENCVFDGGTVAAIVSEGFANNLIIRGNVFSNNGFRWDYGNIDGGRGAAVIQIDKTFDNPGAKGQAFQNTVIRNNTFIANAGLGIAVSNAAGTRLEGNLFIDSHPTGPRPLRPLKGLINGQDSSAQIWLKNDHSVGLKDNTVVSAGHYANKLLAQGEGNTEIKGEQDGVALGKAQLYQAEDAVVTAGRIGTGAGAIKGKFVSGLTHDNSSVKFEIEAPLPGRYALVMSYDNASRDEQRRPLMATQTVVVNGNLKGASTILYPYTNFWAQFHPSYASAVVVTLKAGKNVVEFQHAVKSAELDQLRVVQVG